MRVVWLPPQGEETAGWRKSEQKEELPMEPPEEELENLVRSFLSGTPLLMLGWVSKLLEWGGDPFAGGAILIRLIMCSLSSACNSSQRPFQGEFQVRKDTLPIVWNMGQRVSQWKQAHQRGYHIDQLTQDKTLKSTILKHERDTKAAVPLPLQEVIEEEVLEILKETLKDYRKYLGADHNLTLQLEEQAEKLHLRLKGRGVID
ncbi:UNVERIFIED_CONTAM: hypothetical protein K2H54_010305 [Gekko kuhli]